MRSGILESRLGPRLRASRTAPDRVVITAIDTQRIDNLLSAPLCALGAREGLIRSIGRVDLEI
jgi:hypothetical protein